MKRVRCAIYTRKSSDEGLEQDFNSLDAQREACAAYVLSQAPEGWVQVAGIYDDGGVSGGTLERPALRRLLADIAEGRVDIVVVYKVDRLTRSLLDFAKLVEAFDRAGASFVSVTQSFNTTTSMGRLTLNMLLSFAQFEREVTAERIRDKIAASKAKGMWMGGTPPLGYRPDGRSLAIVEYHADIVRDIYRRYLTLGNVRLVRDQLVQEGIRVPARHYGSGRPLGGGVFTRGQLYHILGNAIYTGDIPHKDKVFKGQHAAIIDRQTWDRVQALLADNTQGGKRSRLPNRSLLAGIITDGNGEPMLAVHASKQVPGKGEAGAADCGAVRYRYYVSKPLQAGTGSGAGLRLPAREIEGLLREHVACLFDDPLDLAARLGADISPDRLRLMGERCADIAAKLRTRGGGPLRTIIAAVCASEHTLEVTLDLAGIAELAGIDSGGATGNTKPGPSPAPASAALTIPYRLTRTGQALRLVQADGTFAGTEANAALVAMIVQAHRWWRILAEGSLDVRTLAKREGISEGFLTRTLRAAFLSPDVTEAILTGRQRADVSAAALRHPGAIAVRWEEQKVKMLPNSAVHSLGDLRSPV